MKLFLSSLVIFLALAQSCSNEQVVVVEKKSHEHKLSEDNVFKDYETALDKAKGVEQTIMDAANQRKKEMQERRY